MRMPLPPSPPPLPPLPPERCSYLDYSAGLWQCGWTLFMDLCYGVFLRSEQRGFTSEGMWYKSTKTSDMEHNVSISLLQNCSNLTSSSYPQKKSNVIKASLLAGQSCRSGGSTECGCRWTEQCTGSAGRQTAWIGQSASHVWWRRQRETGDHVHVSTV